MKKYRQAELKLGLRNPALSVGQGSELESKVKSGLRATISVTRLAREVLKEEKRQHQKCFCTRES